MTNLGGQCRCHQFMMHRLVEGALIQLVLGGSDATTHERSMGE